MKALRIYIMALLILPWACTPQSTEETEDDFTLVGTWKLMKYIDSDQSDREWKSYDEDVIYLKHITPTHFTWLRYDQSKDQMAGTGGGTYKFANGIYEEDIHFFHPPGSSELGQAIPFEAQFKDGEWYHKGFAKVIEFDPETGEMVVVDSSKIEEVWERTNAPVASQEFVGTWELISYKTENDSLWIEYPDFVGYLKHITPTHFNWIYYNAEGDEVMSEGGGLFVIDGNKYTEKIMYQHGTEQNIVGLSADFEFRIEDGKWYHTGYVVGPVMDPETREKVGMDTSKIEEIWMRYGRDSSL